MTTQEKIAKNLKYVRDQKRMTQEDVAKKAKISTNYYSRIERCDAVPTITTLEQIVKALGVKSSEILPF
ncbi:helix-turn-helix transcriptional regulator [Candidatus Saccharibacteria bacterium]|nr:helix-turn-helix transcriptional regulator [Candidatus Saccharibacteria bacterium]